MIESREEFVSRLQECEEFYSARMCPTHSDYDPDMLEYYRGKYHGIKICTSIVKSYFQDLYRQEYKEEFFASVDEEDRRVRARELLSDLAALYGV